MCKATNGLKGLDVLANENITLVMLDYKMPGMDGLEVLDRIREMWPKCRLFLSLVTVLCQQPPALLKGEQLPM